MMSRFEDESSSDAPIGSGGVDEPGASPADIIDVSPSAPIKIGLSALVPVFGWCRRALTVSRSGSSLAGIPLSIAAATIPILASAKQFHQLAHVDQLERVLTVAVGVAWGVRFLSHLTQKGTWTSRLCVYVAAELVISAGWGWLIYKNQHAVQSGLLVAAGTVLFIAMGLITARENWLTRNNSELRFGARFLFSKDLIDSLAGVRGVSWVFAKLTEPEGDEKGPTRWTQIIDGVAISVVIVAAGADIGYLPVSAAGTPSSSPATVTPAAPASASPSPRPEPTPIPTPSASTPTPTPVAQSSTDPTYDGVCGRNSSSVLGEGAPPVIAAALYNLILGPGGAGGIFAGCAGPVESFTDSKGTIYFQPGYGSNGLLSVAIAATGYAPRLLLGDEAAPALHLLRGGLRLY